MIYSADGRHCRLVENPSWYFTSRSPSQFRFKNPQKTKTNTQRGWVRMEWEKETKVKVQLTVWVWGSGWAPHLWVVRERGCCSLSPSTGRWWRWWRHLLWLLAAKTCSQDSPAIHSHPWIKSVNRPCVRVTLRSNPPSVRPLPVFPPDWSYSHVGNILLCPFTRVSGSLTRGPYTLYLSNKHGLCYHRCTRLVVAPPVASWARLTQSQEPSKVNWY